ncbi:hypothetical protein [Mangrovibacillus cuniculi]|uniref:Uncharacterized protein n=1 Tax=Mangrovibacillus cuniculi TaxID=2593652 RepID=A0A7S8CC26_9BACI|nr:hypothetical protein [Mangrovibacillus cuniculi]QPC47220.1 hypothetical protein G8O30_09670 [Mangrovibacillus cuniculi]
MNRRIRYSISFVALLGMVFWSLPYLGLQAGGVQQVFAISWVLFAFVAIGANLHGMLNKPSVAVANNVRKVEKKVKERQRVYG